MFLCWGIRDVRAVDNRPGHFLRNGQDRNMQRRLYNNFGLTQHLGGPPEGPAPQPGFLFVRAPHRRALWFVTMTYQCLGSNRS